MGSRQKKWLKGIIVCIDVLVVLAGCYGLYSLHAERNALQQEVAELNTKVALLKKKYAEQRALADAMLRAKQAVESRARDALATVAELENRNKELQEANKAYEGKIAELEKQYTARIAKLQEQHARLRTAYDELREESNRIIKEKNQKITELTNENQSLQVSLNQETLQHTRCRKNNARLSELAEEVVGRYEHKSVLGSLVESEPFTQLKKIELEKLIQEYRDTIDKETL